VEHDEYPGFAIDALEEIVAEALARTNVGLAVRVLSNLGNAVKGNADAALEHSRRLATSRSRLASRTHVSLVAGLLRQGTGPTQADLAAEYLRLVAPEGAQELAELLADERDRRVRGRMCQVLARLGADVLPVLLPRLQDKRWHLVRNILSVLGRMRHQSAFRPVAAALDHSHPRVRLEAVRALALIGGAQATGPLLHCVTDPDRTVRRAAIKWLGDLRNEEAVSALRDIVIAPVEVPEDWEVKEEAARALVGIGTPFALGLLAQIAGWRVWFWKRTDKRIRALAGEALRARPTPDGNAARDEE
jgi:HEAT repeat protein